MDNKIGFCTFDCRKVGHIANLCVILLKTSTNLIWTFFSPFFQVTRPVLNLGVQDVPSPVSPVSGEVVPTALAREPSATCAVADACSLLPRSGVSGTHAPTSARSASPCAPLSLPQQSQLSSCPKVMEGGSAVIVYFTYGNGMFWKGCHNSFGVTLNSFAVFLTVH